MLNLIYGWNKSPSLAYPSTLRCLKTFLIIKKINFSSLQSTDKGGKLIEKHQTNSRTESNTIKPRPKNLKEKNTIKFRTHNYKL